MRQWTRLLTTAAVEEADADDAPGRSADLGARYWWLLPGDATYTGPAAWSPADAARR
ncbi:hypothetical protein ACFOD8_05115 [Arthrobacter agilis]|uniref:hypothetical protein n=1 Tax=Arthrobacter agilis TaxID=37921 RepID=UPI001304CBF6|nr:hypothetical protein [Arthrobacter agilis]